MTPKPKVFLPKSGVQNIISATGYMCTQICIGCCIKDQQYVGYLHTIKDKIPNTLKFF